MLETVHETVHETVQETDASATAMQREISGMYEQLKSLGMYEHARDFWRMRAAKQQQQVLDNSLLHQHTALTQYMKWHNTLGVRLPSFLRGSESCIASGFQSGFQSIAQRPTKSAQFTAQLSA